tara:strand:+ start:770 stop:2398 length:1629 start_codon:yes stop_codon:yes gene_type:complete
MGQIKIPRITTAQRTGSGGLTLAAGELVYDTDTGYIYKGDGSTAGGVQVDGTGTATNVTVADESSDGTCFPLFATAATGALPPKSGSNLTFNSSSGILATPTFSGDLSGTINTATTAVTQSSGNNSTRVATTAYVDAAGNTLTQAQVEDFAGGLFTGNTETGITATYQEADNTVDLVVNLAAGGLTDVDTSSVAANDILVWNGSGFVVESMATMMGNNTLFTFALSSFSDGISGTQLIGDGTWKSADAINFSAVYVAGPPGTSATIQKSINGGSYSDMNAMDSAAFTSGNNDAAVGYPSAKDQTLQFRLKVVNDGVTAYANGGALSFQNKVFYGASTSTSLNEAGVEGLSSAITNSYLSSRSINSSSGKYVYIAFPATYADIHANGFKFNDITCPFGSKATVTITNTAGYEEDYDVYRSVNNNLGNSTLNLSTSSTINNTIFYGLTTATSSLSVSSFVSSPGEATNADVTRQWPSITTGAGQYMLFAWPARFSDPTFNVGGFDGGFESATTANFTNDNGYTESYKFFRATNPNLGAKVVTTS